MTGKEIIFVAAALGVAAMGCSKETTSSTNIKTAGIAALIDVTASNSTTSRVHAELLVGGDESNTYVVLDSGDKLIAEAGGETKEMQAIEEGVYEVSFSTVEADTEFKVTLERPNDTTAAGNRGTLPAPFAISAPTKSDTISRAEDLVITWDAAAAGAASMTIEIDGTCIYAEDIEVPGDTGTYTVKGGTLKSTKSDMPETCDLDLTITRSRSGTTDTALDNESWFRLHQARGTSFTSSP